MKVYQGQIRDVDTCIVLNTRISSMDLGLVLKHTNLTYVILRLDQEDDRPFAYKLFDH